jgi:hypothetical protein
MEKFCPGVFFIGTWPLESVILYPVILYPCKSRSYQGVFIIPYFPGAVCFPVVAQPLRDFPEYPPVRL